MVKNLARISMMAITMVLTACAIEPPLKLADSRDVVIEMPEVITDIDLIWEIDPEWRATWWYGWDDEDIQRFGPIDYPIPLAYQTRIYYLGSDPANHWLGVESQRVEGNSFRRRFAFGYHDILLWSEIISPDGTQTLRIDESDPDNIIATTSMTSLSYAPPSRGEAHHNPEIFYAGLIDDFNVTRNIEDYDYYDTERNVWVKKVNTTLYPLVYTYLVQVVMYNNRGRVTGTRERSSITSMADAVSVHTGHTSDRDITVTYDMRMKRALKARNGREADILGGKLTSFGLCDMEPWHRSRATQYRGSRGDLSNHVMVNFAFFNSTDSVLAFDVTDQIQRQSHGGVITIELDMDTIPVPTRPSSGGGSAFDPTIADTDSVTYIFGM